MENQESLSSAAAHRERCVGLAGDRRKLEFADHGARGGAMGTRTEHAPGTFSYVDLSTTDPDGAKAFYGELFGWDFDDQEVGDGMVYTNCRIEGATAGAISGQMEQERRRGGPPDWDNYATVQDADPPAQRAKEARAEVGEEPFRRMEA